MNDATLLFNKAELALASYAEARSLPRNPKKTGALGPSNLQ